MRLGVLELPFVSWPVPWHQSPFAMIDQHTQTHRWSDTQKHAEGTDSITLIADAGGNRTPKKFKLK